MFGWAFAEAIAWPIIPEFLLVPLAAGAAARRRIWGLLLSSILGSAVGGALLYLYAMKHPDEARASLARLPLVTDRQIGRASVSLRTHGVGALLLQPWMGVPLKVWAIIAAEQGLDPRLAIPTFAISRALRMAVLSVLAAMMGDWLRPFLRDHSLFAAVAYVIVFFFGERRIVR
jgi:1-acyl-sn-glycerol-3-phosphate acyltransferase